MQPSTRAKMRPLRVSPVSELREKGMYSEENHGLTAAFMALQSPATEGEFQRDLISSISSALQMCASLLGDSTGRTSNSSRVIITTFRVVVEPICAPIVSARVVSSACVLWNSSISSLRRRLLPLASLSLSRTLMKRVIRTSRRNRRSRSNRTLRPARVPMRAARAARAMGPFSLRSFPSSTKMSMAMESVAMKSRKKKRLKL
mmetsp:Transcript_35265/g.100461  ORF Transcript_35265/g.100461 Transcript_35265/m.100461 type:complete len:203 (-) Transcript_35265:851-1459(-)